MKSFWLTRNRRHPQAGNRRGAPRLSLFPFLAVLICTMGALFLVLLTVTRQARLQAAREAAARDAEKQSSIAADLDMVQWRVDQLKKSRQDTEAQLAQARLVLGHLEDHGRRLRNQFQELSRQAARAADEGLKPGNFATAGEEELRKIEDQIAQAQRQLAQAQQAVGSRPKSFAIVPYDGPNHTRRRPIYIECRGDAVVLQPENIVFDEGDFDEPLGPGNPLAAAIRAAREQMLLHGSSDPENTGDPYPLLLVRPDGILAYECALAAMQSWGSEFGYELINESWQLKYPPPDPNVAKAVQQAIFLARQEHARLIAAAPSKYGKRPRIGAYRSSAGGDTAEQGGSGEGEGGSPGFYSSKPSDRYARDGAGGGSSAAGQGGSGRGARGGGGSGRFGIGGGDEALGGGSSGPAGDAEFAANNPYASLTAPGAPPGNGAAGAGPGYAPSGMGQVGYGPRNGMAGAGPSIAPGMAGSPGIGQGGPGGGTGNGMGSGAAAAGPGFAPGPGQGGSGIGSGYNPGNGAGGTPFAAVVGNTFSAQNMNPDGATNNFAPAGNAAMAQANGQPDTGSPATAAVARPDGYISGRPNDGNPQPVPAPQPSNVAMAPATPLRPGEWREETPPPKPDPDAAAKEKKKHPYDKVKLDHDQEDWALRNSTRNAAAISRPIHVDCYPDRVVLKSEADSEPRVVFCNNDRRDADKFVVAVWEIMDTWGMAGREMYWRPVLNFYVVPGAERRMFDLSRSLEGSGLVIERKQ
jgi:hypothetical protein